MPDPHVNVGLYTRPKYTFATLPAATSNVGEILYITDASANPAVSSGLVAVGGGTTLSRVLSDGTVWRLYAWAD
jgi:hypothetical protein